MLLKSFCLTKTETDQKFYQEISFVSFVIYIHDVGMTGQNDDNNDITDNSDNIQNSDQIPRPTVLLMMFYMTVASIHCP